MASDTGQGVALWLYGSYARGDHDHLSDIDVFLMGERTPVVESAVESCDSSKVIVSAHTPEEFGALVSHGSILLHHIRREGRPLIEIGAAAAAMRAGLQSLPAYRGVGANLQSFRLALFDIRESLRDFPSYSLEASALAVCVRHMAILGCYLMGVPTFGRTTAVRCLIAHLGERERIAERFEDLHRFRLAELGRLDGLEPPSRTLVQEWLRDAEWLLRQVEGLC